MRIFFQIIIGLLVLALPVARAGNKPNIVTVFVDDMGWSDLSCFDGKAVRTEHIDRLAAEGIRFTNFYVNSPICSPSRVALTTGQYPQRWRITSYLAHRKQNRSRGMAQWLDPKAPVLARELQKAGYATGHFGKWHMGGQRDVADAPEIGAYGFDNSLTNFEGMGAKLLPLTLKPGNVKGRIWEKAEILGGPVTWMQRSEITGGFVDAALEFIREARGKGKPFFVNIWPDDVHSPFFPPLDKWGNGKRELYNGVLDAMDEQLAKLFDFVRGDEELRNNTLVIFCSDNGHESGAGRSDPLRGAKTWLYEGGIRSPLIVWGPGLVKGNGVVNKKSVFSAIDLNCSLYAISGIAPPAGLDGENVADAILGKAQNSRKAPIFFRRPPDRPGFGHGLDEDNPDLAVRDGKWKYLVNHDGGEPQLYDLEADKAESKNLAEKHPGIAKRLDTELREWNAGMPSDAGDPRHAARAVGPDEFVNPIAEGADPWVMYDPSSRRYLWCLSEGNRAIAIHASPRLSHLGPKRIVWRAPEEGPVSRQVWAPELHFIDGRWHIYFAASDGKNENHQAYVLRSRASDPLGNYDLHGPLTDVWAIDMTPLRHKGRLYALWSGWDAPGTDRQFLYIAPMKSPTELAGERVRICGNDDHPWEFTEDNGKGRGLNEGPQVLKSGKRTFVTYSCGGSWLPTYKLGMLELVGDDPLDPKSWKKFAKPVFQGTAETYGVGHSCFVKSRDREEWWHVFHAKRDRKPGWRRAISMQPMSFGKNGLPKFGKPVAPGAILSRPSGEKDGLAWSYFGHHQYLALDDETFRIELGAVPEHPVNGYRCGEKLVYERTQPDDMAIEVAIDFMGNAKSRDAGVLFRTTGPSVGYDAQRGYFAGLIPRSGLVILGRTDGHRWQELARVPANVDASVPQRLKVECEGKRFVVSLNGEEAIRHEDGTYSSGRVGLRVVDTHAAFSDLRLSSKPR